MNDLVFNSTYLTSDVNVQLVVMLSLAASGYKIHIRAARAVSGEHVRCDILIESAF